MKSNKPLGRKKELVTQETDGEVMVYDLNTNKAVCLNETSALVWQLCDGARTVGEISEGLSKKLASPANEDLVWLAIDQLKKENLIVNSEELETNSFDGMSRREVIKKVGLGTMIALPFVAGIIAPKAIQAASTCTAAVGARGTCSCSFAQSDPANGGPVGSPCRTDVGPGGNNSCVGGCQPTFAQAGSAVCACT